MINGWYALKIRYSINFGIFTKYIGNTKHSYNSLGRYICMYVQEHKLSEVFISNVQTLDFLASGGCFGQHTSQIRGLRSIKSSIDVTQSIQSQFICRICRKCTIYIQIQVFYSSHTFVQCVAILRQICIYAVWINIGVKSNTVLNTNCKKLKIIFCLVVVKPF